MSEALQGRTRTEETRKMSEAHKGKKFIQNKPTLRPKISPPSPPLSHPHLPHTCGGGGWERGAWGGGGGVEGINLFLRFEDVRVILGHRTKLPPPSLVPSCLSPPRLPPPNPARGLGGGAGGTKEGGELNY